MTFPRTFADSELARVVEWALTGSATDEEIAVLAQHLAASGERVSWPTTTIVADVASTGGPGSLTTLVCPVALVAAGCSVVKLAVPGRPAGAIDTFATIPGYRTRLQTRDLPRIMQESRFAHFLADERFAPLDAALFAYRRRVGAVAVPALAIASLLSKKLAVGIQHVGLDVRVGAHGNFGTTLEEARHNARRFCAVARLLGITATAFIAAQRSPSQPWIGRGEGLLALAHAVGDTSLQRHDDWLDHHVADCAFMATEVASLAGTGNGVGGPPPTAAALREALASHLRSQGASYQAFKGRVECVLAAPRVAVHVRGSGDLDIDLAFIRDSLVRHQQDTQESFDDPGGLRMLTWSGAPVNDGQTVATVRSSRVGAIDAADISNAFRVVRPDETVASATLTPDEREKVEVIRA